MASSPYEIPTEMRDFAEKSVAQARKAFEGFIGATQKAMGVVDDSTQTVQTQAKDMGVKAVTYAQQNVTAAFDHAERLTRARDVQEVMSLQSEFVKAQMANIQAQAKEFGTAIQSAASSATKQG